MNTDRPYQSMSLLYIGVHLQWTPIKNPVLKRSWTTGFISRLSLFSIHSKYDGPCYMATMLTRINLSLHPPRWWSQQKTLKHGITIDAYAWCWRVAMRDINFSCLHRSSYRVETHRPSYISAIPFSMMRILSYDLLKIFVWQSLS